MGGDGADDRRSLTSGADSFGWRTCCLAVNGPVPWLCASQLGRLALLRVSRPNSFPRVRILIVVVGSIPSRRVPPHDCQRARTRARRRRVLLLAAAPASPFRNFITLPSALIAWSPTCEQEGAKILLRGKHIEEPRKQPGPQLRPAVRGHRSLGYARSIRRTASPRF